MTEDCLIGTAAWRECIVYCLSGKIRNTEEGDQAFSISIVIRSHIFPTESILAITMERPSTITGLDWWTDIFCIKNHIYGL